MDTENREQKIPLHEKVLLSLREAAAYSGVGINRIRELSNERDCSFVVFVGRKRLIKREPFTRYLLESYSL